MYTMYSSEDRCILLKTIPAIYNTQNIIYSVSIYGANLNSYPLMQYLNNDHKHTYTED